MIDFIHGLRYDDLPAAVVEQARRCLLDLIGTAAGGSTTDAARIIRNHAARHYGAGEQGASLLFDGRRVSAPGAALAGAMLIDSLDCHDGHVLTKGHVGVAVLPALLAFARVERWLRDVERDELHFHIPVVRNDRERGEEGRLQTFRLALGRRDVFLQERDIALALHRQQIRNSKYALTLAEALANTLALGVGVGCCLRH